MPVSPSPRSVRPQGPPAAALEAIEVAARARFADEEALLTAILSGHGDGPIAGSVAYTAFAAYVGELRDGSLRDLWFTDLFPELANVAQDGSTDVMRPLGLRATIRPIVAAADKQATKLAATVTSTTADGLVEAFRGVKAAGGSAADLLQTAKQTVFDQAKIDMRAELVREQEARTAYHTGAQLAAEQSGIIQSKIWRHDGSPEVPRPDHEEMDGETVALDDVFSSGLDRPCDPDGDPEDVMNCTCSLEYSDLAPDEDEDVVQ